MALTVPKLSAPLVKDIRTSEGILENVLGVAVSVLTATGDVRVNYGVGVLSLLVLVKGLRRGLIKLVGLDKGVIGSPIDPSPVAAGVISGTGQVAADVVKTVETVKSTRAAAKTTAAKQAAAAAPKS